MPFQVYRKIQRLGHDENLGILEGTCVIQEKVDGANTSIWLEDGELKCGSRTRELSEGFNGFVEYAKNHEGIKKLLGANPRMRLYGEWLVRHTIAYNELVYKKFYLFDIERDGKFLAPADVRAYASIFDIDIVHEFAVLENPVLADLEKFLGQTVLGSKGEGIVIKNVNFVNKFGDQVYAKMVTQEFKEDNSTVFGGNNKYSDTYWEQYVVNKYMSVARVKKIMNKMQPKVDVKLDMEHTPMIGNASYHDMITEEIWEIQKKVPEINFTALRRLSIKKAIRIFHDILNGHESVAYNPILNDEGNNS